MLPALKKHNPLSISLSVDAPDVILTDIRMPGIDGLTFLGKVKGNYPDLPVIIMTAHSDLESAVSSYQTGAFEYLPKPFDIDEALALVKSCNFTYCQITAARISKNRSTDSID